MKILFLDQSGKSGGAELCLLDVARFFCESFNADRDASTLENPCLVGLFEDGDFRLLLEAHQIPVRVLAERAIEVRKSSGLLKGLSSLNQLAPLVNQIAALSRQFDVVYANTQKSLIIGAIAAALSDRPLVYHLHDILSPEHFSSINRRLSVLMANRAKLVIANSQATRSAFIEAGGRAELVEVVYNGFDIASYQREAETALRTALDLEGRFVVGQFSRLSPWKGQHVLLQALTQCNEQVTALFVGDALFGEQAYVEQLHDQVQQLGLSDRVRFLGFRTDVIPLMQLCDVVAHTSTAAEPFGRVIVEAMLCGKPTIASKAGAAPELIDPGVTGWLTQPGDASELADAIESCRQNFSLATQIAQQAQQQAQQRFDLAEINQQIAGHLTTRLRGHFRGSR